MKFDFIIGNPPYLRVQGLRENYEKESKYYEKKSALSNKKPSYFRERYVTTSAVERKMPQTKKSRLRWNWHKHLNS